MKPILKFRITKRHGLWISAFLLLLAATGIVGYQLSDRAFLSSVYLQFPDGRVIQASPDRDGIFYEPDIHPKGTHVIYFGNTSGPPRIWKTEVTSLKTVALTSPEHGARHPSYSRDGTRIVFASDMKSGQPPEQIERMGRNGVPPKNLKTHIYVMDSSGSHIRQITFGEHQDQRPCFDPSGHRIAFVSDRSGATSIWLVDADGNSEPRQIAYKAYSYRPCFSVDGNFLFFFTKTHGRHQIAKLRLDNGSVMLLGNDTYGDSHGPFADPGGKVLLMHSRRNGVYNIWEVPLDGSPARNIQPPGFFAATHATRSENGIMAFDVARYKWWLREKAARLKRVLFPRKTNQ